MIFQELILENFGPYRGRQVLDLRPRDEQRTIILFGGMNGGGKTTLMDAIRLALYGHRASCASRGTLSYPEFLKQCINRQAKSSTVEMAFKQTLNNEAQPTEFRIHRTWTDEVSNRDTLQIFTNGEIAPDLAQKWDERIEDLLPLGISRLFLFDGEQVGELADQDTLPQSVMSAIRSLLGLELPDRLSADLDVLTSRKRKSLATAQEQAQIEEIEERLRLQNLQSLEFIGPGRMKLAIETRSRFSPMAKSHQTLPRSGTSASRICCRSVFLDSFCLTVNRSVNWQTKTRCLNP